MGYHRDTFYDVQRAFQIGGVAALVEERRGPKNPNPNRVSGEVEQKILDYALRLPQVVVPRQLRDLKGGDCSGAPKLIPPANRNEPRCRSSWNVFRSHGITATIRS